MTRFNELQKNAKQLSERLHYKELHYSGSRCITFFSILAPTTDVARKDAITIALLASSLDNKYDPILRQHFNTTEDFSTFKEQVLTGLYLLKWFQYNSIMTGYLNRCLIDLFRKDLELPSLDSMKSAPFNLCLDSLSRYCSYLYTHKEKPLNCTLNARLGEQVQWEIVQVREKSFARGPSLFNDIKNVFGM